MVEEGMQDCPLLPSSTIKWDTVVENDGCLNLVESWLEGTLNKGAHQV